MSNVSRGVSKEEWLLAGLEELKRGGVQTVKIERLSKIIGVARAGFYWHFRKRDNLLDSMFQYWAEEYTYKVLQNPELKGLLSRDRLLKIADSVIDRNLASFEIAIRAWAQSDAAIAAAYQEVLAARFDFVKQAFAELGFTGGDLEMRANVFVSYVSWKRPLKLEETQQESHQIFQRFFGLLTTETSSY